MIKCIIARSNIIMSPSQLPRIQCQDTRRKPALHRPLQKRYRKLVIMWHVKLEKPNPAFSITASHILDTRTPSRGQTVRQSQLASYLGNWQFALWVVYLI